MRKYLFIFKSEVMSSLQYVFNVMTGFIGYLIHIFIFLNVWQYIYSDPNQVINGYSMNQMIWYVIITELLWSILGGRGFCKRISNDVRSGNIAYNMNKPYSYIGYVLSSSLGGHFIRSIIYTVLAMLVGFLFMGSFPSLTLFSILAVILTSILATIISSFLIISLGLISFYIEDANPFYWLYSKVILIVGTLFPIEFFPKVIQPILVYSPIYVVSYGPAKLFVQFSYGEFFKILLAQIIYIFITYGLCKFMYNRGVKKLNVNGG